MRWPLLKCPLCGGILPNSELKPGKPLCCPDCSREWQPSRWQLRLSGLIALCLTIGICLLAGLRGFWLLGAIVLFWFPAFVAWDFVFVRLVPPAFEAYRAKDSRKSGRGGGLSIR
jgi:hypothetical protein